VTVGLDPQLVGLGGPRYTSTRGARVVKYELDSRLLGRKLTEAAAVPAGTPRRRPLLVLMGGRNSDIEGLLSDPFFLELRRLDRLAPVVVFPNGGDHSYFHDRRDGPWGSYVLREVIPDAERRFATNGRIAIGGISMGGFGALDLARLAPGRFCAVGGHSAATWTEPGLTAPGAFDDREDYLRHDLFAYARSGHAYRGVPLWLDNGTADPFRASDTELAALLRRRDHASLRFHIWPGAHDHEYWDAHMPAYLDFYANALRRCR
jgi:S-formylglutathione hydrolase FrmB